MVWYTISNHMSITQRFGQFLKDIGHSCYDMELYRRVRTRPLAAAFGYFTAFSLLVSLLMLGLLAPNLVVMLRDARQYVDTRLPMGAFVQLKSSEMRTNLSQPYNFGSDKMPVMLDTNVNGLSFPENVKFDSGVLVGRDAVFVKQSANETRTYSFKGMKDFLLSREDAAGWLGRYGALAVIGLSGFFFIAYFLASLIGTAIFVVAASVVSLLLGLLWRVRLTYAQWLAVGFHAVTLPIILDGLFGALNLNISFAFTLIFYMFAVAVIADERSHPVAAGPVSAEERVPAPGASPAEQPPAATKRPSAARKPAKPRTRRKRPPEGPASPPAAPPEGPPSP